MADVFATALAPVADKIDVAFIYGSVARGQETAGSDIDLMLVGTLGFDEAVHVLWPLQAELGREINPQVLGQQEFAARAQAAFMRDVLSKPKIFVMGVTMSLQNLVGISLETVEPNAASAVFAGCA